MRDERWSQPANSWEPLVIALRSFDRVTSRLYRFTLDFLTGFRAGVFVVFIP